MAGFDVDIPDSSFDGAPAEAPASIPAESLAPEAPAATIPAESPAPASNPAESAPEPDVFDRAYVEQLRQESAGYRTKAKPFTDAYDGMDEADRDTFLYLAQTYKSDPVRAAQEMQRLAQGLMGDESDAGDPPAADAAPDVMTVSKYQEMRKEEAIQAEAKNIERQAVDLGYAKGTPEYQYLLAVARNGDGDLTAAHGYIQQREQTAIQAYLTRKAAEADGAPTVGSGPSAPASTERQIKTWRDAEAAIDEMLG
jgi:hypothetical protein